ncbi:MAG TPA: M3 family oligoendopeptidase [Anaerolineae bacterium]|nr:M3 family oligoendopeptidase [Anaerolineae bacterium]HQK14119.1 M3 family oligoendopeptidase [Anaerolineae bacterium]
MPYEPQRWKLTDLLAPAGTPEMEHYFADIEARLAELEALRDRLTPDIAGDTFRDILARCERLHADAGRLMAYAYLWFSEDVANQDALAFLGHVEQFVAEMQNRALFFELWWKALDDDAAARLMENVGDTRYYLESLRRFKPHTLSEPEEKIINIKNVNGIQAVKTIYDMLTNAFEFHLTVDGEEKELTRGQLAFYFTSPDPNLRAAAYQELYRVYATQADVLAYIYATRVRDWQAENLKLRAFASPISVRNLENDIPDAVVETLLHVIRQNAPLFRRFFRFKAQALGVARLRRYDLYAPLASVEKTYSFDTAVRMVDAAYRAFSPTLADHAMRVLEAGHLDSEIRPRKMSGAFCYGPLPGLTPWVQVNFQGKIQDVSTLAHELGHAVHSIMAGGHSPLTFHSSLPMAETASVFGEMLLNDKLLAEETDFAVRRALIGTLLDDAYATIMRQGYFVIFEKQAHQMIVDGAKPDDLYAAYLDNLREQFGDAVELSDDFRYEWVSIPHIYDRPFYCYAYAFGNLLVLALYRKYKELGKAFEPDYLRILAYGGSASPQHIISEAGFDMTSPDFWQGGFDLLAGMLEDLEGRQDVGMTG